MTSFVKIFGVSSARVSICFTNWQFSRKINTRHRATLVAGLNQAAMRTKMGKLVYAFPLISTRLRGDVEKNEKWIIYSIHSTRRENRENWRSMSWNFEEICEPSFPGWEQRNSSRAEYKYWFYDLGSSRTSTGEEHIFRCGAALRINIPRLIRKAKNLKLWSRNMNG